MGDCLFCKIVEGRSPRTSCTRTIWCWRSSTSIRAHPFISWWFRRSISTDARKVRGEHGPLLGRMFTVAGKVAKEEGVAESGFRLGFNVGDDAGMTASPAPAPASAGDNSAPKAEARVRWLVAAALTAVVVVLGACGGDDDDDPTGTPESTSTAGGPRSETPTEGAFVGVSGIAVSFRRAVGGGCDVRDRARAGGPRGSGEWRGVAFGGGVQGAGENPGA